MAPRLRYVDPFRPRGRFSRTYAAFSGKRLGRFLSEKVAWKVDPYLLRATRGRLGMGLVLPTALLETRGAKTGAVRRNAVIYFHDSDRDTIIASKAGTGKHPGWFHNLRAHPRSCSAASPCGRRLSATKPNATGSGRSQTASSHRTRRTVKAQQRQIGRSRSSNSPRASQTPSGSPFSRSSRSRKGCHRRRRCTAFRRPPTGPRRSLGTKARWLRRRGGVRHDHALRPREALGRFSGENRRFAKVYERKAQTSVC